MLGRRPALCHMDVVGRRIAFEAPESALEELGRLDDGCFAGVIGIGLIEVPDRALCLPRALSNSNGFTRGTRRVKRNGEQVNAKRSSQGTALKFDDRASSVRRSSGLTAEAPVMRRRCAAFRRSKLGSDCALTCSNRNAVAWPATNDEHVGVGSGVVAWHVEVSRVENQGLRGSTIVRRRCGARCDGSSWPAEWALILRFPREGRPAGQQDRAGSGRGWSVQSESALDRNHVLEPNRDVVGHGATSATPSRGAIFSHVRQPREWAFCRPIARRRDSGAAWPWRRVVGAGARALATSASNLHVLSENLRAPGHLCDDQSVRPFPSLKAFIPEQRQDPGRADIEMNSTMAALDCASGQA